MHERTGKWKWDVENDVNMDKNDTVTVSARERDLVRERERVEQSKEQQAAAVRGGGFLSFIVSALAAVSRGPHTFDEWTDLDLDLEFRAKQGSNRQ